MRTSCKACGKALAATNRIARYCSKECRAEGVRRSRRKVKSGANAGPGKRALAAAQVGARYAAYRGEKRR